MNDDRAYLLLIDDSHADAMMIERIVAKSGVDVGFRWIQDPELALQQLATGLPEQCLMILLDIKMPKLTGLELLAALEARSSLPYQPPIMVFSSSSLDRDREAATNFPGVSYHSKPEGYLEGKRWLTPILQTLSEGKPS